MSITVRERFDSQNLTLDSKGNEITLEYWAMSSDLDTPSDKIAEAVWTYSPANFAYLLRARIKPNHLGGGFWHVSVDYRPKEWLNSDDQSGTPAGETYDELTPLKGEFSFTTTGGTTHITQSLETVGEYLTKGAPGPVPKTRKAIGLSKNGVAGTEILTRKVEFSITRETTRFTLGYVNKLALCTGAVNNRRWNSFDPYTLLFMGATGSPQGTVTIGNLQFPKWLLTYTFLVGKNEKDLVLAKTGKDDEVDALIVKEKRAHDYLWVGYRTDVEPTAGVMLEVPHYAKVERVYPYRDFAQLLEF